MATSPVNFLKEVSDELKKVVWPSRDEIIRLTAVVIIVSALVGLYLGGADFILTKIVEAVILKR
ncbi:MAG: preprotein translocase subunit SecE [Candidatus Levybacteria bacterium RBG_13_35_9]|nr:MAG: preprotein translocase subunit SecE [Candidatus Levybacteria bacterium RBG_13_35_9]